MSDSQTAIVDKLKQVDQKSVDPLAAYAAIWQGTPDSKTEPPKTTADDRYQPFFRVKIGGHSAPVDTSKPGIATTGSPTNLTPNSLTNKTNTPLAPTTGKPDTNSVSSTPISSTDTTKTQTTLTTANVLNQTGNSDIKMPDWMQTANVIKPQAPNTPPTIKVGSTDFDTQIFNKTATTTSANDTSSTPREMIFDTSKGDFEGRLYLRISTYQHATVKFTLHDPGDVLRPQITKLQSVEVEAGFINGFKINKFIGVIYSIARKLPTGLEIEAIDVAYKLQAKTESTIVNTDKAVPAQSSKVGDFQVLQTLQGEASFYGGSDGFDGKKTANGETFDSTKLTAANQTLPFGTNVRVTNTANQKSVIVKINDRGPYSGNRIIDLTKAAAQAIGMIETGSATVKLEVLGDKPQVAPNAIPAAGLANSTVATPQPTAPVAVEKTTLAQVFSKQDDLRFINNGSQGVDKKGEVVVSQTLMNAASQEANLQGNVLVAKGNTVQAVAPGGADNSGVILDYGANRSVFLFNPPPLIKKRTNVQLQSGFGATTVKGWNVNDKQVVGATVVIPSPPKQHPTGAIQAPAWGTINLSDPIIPGCPYTWADATRNGERVPASKEIIEGIIRIATIITPLTEQTVGKGKRWEINSWYRDPASNAAVGGAPLSRHLNGDAVDFFFPGMEALHQKLYDTWNGGVAISPGSFVHIDDRGSQGEPQARWTY